MKKTISTNISGILFHIEEDGYEMLRAYLDSINAYFAALDDSKEIIDDIESRIAEIFLSKISPSKQVIAVDDVAALIRTMGTINDFRATEEAENKTAGDTGNKTGAGPKEKSYEKKLYRDPARKLLGGVAAGFGRYFEVDPIWIRLLLLAFLFGLWFLHSMTFLTLLAYIALWMLLPENPIPEESQKVKKLFRNPEDRIIAGVCSGLAAYFSAEVNLFRAIFVISIFIGGAGIILYIILWAITPQAMTMTDRMQMEGEHLTLSNIIQNIKKELNIKEGGPENLFTTIFLSPFRFISILLHGSEGIARSVFILTGEIFRIVLGLTFLTFPLLAILFLGISLAVLYGALPGHEWFYTGRYPAELMLQDVPKILLIALLSLVLLPLCSMVFTGIALLSKRRLYHRSVGWSLATLFIISLVIVCATLPPFIINFKKIAAFDKTFSLPVSGKILVLKVNGGDTPDFSKIRLTLIGTSDSTARLVQHFSARGKNPEDARQHARKIVYTATLRDSVLNFAAGFSYKIKDSFRGQEVQLYLYLPEGQKVQLDESMEDLLPSFYFEKGNRTNLWVHANTKMSCLSCSDRNKEVFIYGSDRVLNSGPDNRENDRYFDFVKEIDWFENSSDAKNFSLEGFSRIEANGMFTISVSKGDVYKVTAYGNDRNIGDLDIHIEQDLLKIAIDDHPWWWGKNEKIKIEVVCPHLEQLELSGAVRSTVTGFKEPDFHARLSGASFARLNIETTKFQLYSSGAAKIEVNGKSEQAEVTMDGASDYDGYRFKIKNADFNISGASTSEIYAIDRLHIEAAGVSSVRYKGHPHLVKELSGLGRISAQEDD